MEMVEILKKIEELKELAKKAEVLANEIEIEVSAKNTETLEAMNAILDKGSIIDKEEFLMLSQQNAHYEDIKGKIETASYKLTNEVIGNIERIA